MCGRTCCDTLRSGHQAAIYREPRSLERERERARARARAREREREREERERGGERESEL